MDDVRNLPLTLLVEPWIVLRPVRKDSVEYLLMRDSIRDSLLINSISARPSARHPGKFEIIDGLYRFNCAVDLGFETIPCIIKHGVTDDEVLSLQIQANALRPETTPTEYARQLQRIYESRPGMTFAELATAVKKTARWVKDRLGLLCLPDDVQLMVDRGDIPVCNAHVLTRIAPRLRADYVETAKTMTTVEFAAMAAKVIKQFKECVHQGRMDERLAQTEAHAHLRGLKSIKQELELPTEGALVLTAEGCRTPMEAWVAALKWVLHLDRRSVDQQVATHAKRRRTRSVKKESEADNEDLDD